MRSLVIFLSVLLSVTAGAQSGSKGKPVAPAPAAAKKTAPSEKILTLSEYLNQVKSNNPEARAAAANVEVAEMRLNEAEVPYSSEFYSEYKLFSDRKEPTNAFSPVESKGRTWRVGVRDRTTFGLSADVYLNSLRTTLGGAPAFLTYKDYETSAFGLNLQQSLWRNAFGEVDRKNQEAQRANNRMEVLKAKFALKNLLLAAENTYWAVVSYNEIVKLQEENVDRARRLRDWMKQRASMRLFDDVDAMQAQASFEQRELELQTSLNERAGFIRQFNTLRGENSDAPVALSELPTQDFMAQAVSDKSKRMSREDFQIVYEQAEASGAKARANLSAIRPQLDLVGQIAGNGLDNYAGGSLNEATRGQHPNWAVGVVFSVALDYSLIGDMKRSYRAQRAAANDIKEQARFNEQRAWDDLVKKNADAQDLFRRAVSLEKLQTDLVQRERRRLLNGRSTTFQSLQIEQNLAGAQIARVRAQLALLQLHNLIKQFEEVP